MHSDSRPAPAKARAFLAAYRISGSITRAAKAANISKRLHYYWLGHFDKYQKAFERAVVEAGDIYEDEAKRRAVVGVLEPVFYQGRRCGAIRRHSDFLLAMILRRFKPEYREKQPVDSNNTVPPLIINIQSDQSDEAAGPGLPQPEALPGAGGGEEIREDIPRSD